MKALEKQNAIEGAVFPATLGIDKRCIFHNTSPIIFGCEILDGQLRIGTPICVPDKGFLEIGRVAGIRMNNISIGKATKGQKVSVELEQNTSQQHISYGKQFDYKNPCSRKSVGRASMF